METETEKNRAKEQAQAQLESILEMVKELEAAIEDNDSDRLESVEQTIHEDPLSVEVSAGWYTPGSEKAEPAEYRILLCTGGPAVRIVGDLGRWGEPETARIEYQDWFVKWMDYPLNSDEEAAVIRYASQFCYGA